MKQNFELIENAILRRGESFQIPIYEHGVDLPIISEIMGYDFSGTDFTNNEDVVGFWQKLINFYDQMGYPAVSFEMGVKFAQIDIGKSEHDDIDDSVKRGWVDEHSGPIKDWDDLNNKEYWPTVEKAFDFDNFDKICRLVPDHMKIIGGASGGPFEHASFLMGFENLSIMLCEDEDFVEELFRKIGETLVGIAKRISKNEKLGIYRFGDDLGYKTSTMISPSMLRKYVFPWQKRIVEAVHASNKPFLLHSCGQLKDVMDDLIDDVKIDGKHSFEDIIMPVTEAKRIWGDRIALFGGLDVDFLARSNPDQIKEYTKRTMDICAKGGGYAIGSGNTITSYIPVKNYLAMMRAIEEWNG